MNITILNVTIETKPTAKGSYQVADVAFKNNTFQGKVEGKKVMSFGATAEAFKVLATAQPGESYEVNVVKNDKGYNDWVSMQKSNGGGGVSSAPSNAPVSGVRAGSTPAPAGRGFETPEERAQRQIYIVRQSSLSNAVGMLSPGAKASLKVEDVVAVAKKLEGYVLGTDKGASGFEDIPDLDPSFNSDPQID